MSAPPVRQGVWARALWIALDTAERGGLDLTQAFEGLPFDAKSARRLGRVSWDDYVTFIERLQVLAGGSAGLERLTEETFHGVVPEIRALAGALVSPKTLVRVHWEVFAPLIFPVVDFSYEDYGPNRVHLEAWVRPGARPALAVHHAPLGAVRGTPRYLDLPAAVVKGETAADHVSWDVELPPSRTLVARMWRGSGALPYVRTILGYDADGAPTGVSWGGEADAQTRFEVAAQRWTLTPRQGEVLGLLVRGKANKEIAEALNTAENTVELHVTNLLRKSGASSRAELIARFWSELG